MSNQIDGGKFIAVYGPNNIGKTTACRGVVTYISEKLSFPKVEYLKYPVYLLRPTGPRINDYLRKGNPENLSMLEAQKIYAQNRTDYQPNLEIGLNHGEIIIAEDYFDTGKAWGVAGGVDLEELDIINSGQKIPDLSLFLDGERFYQGIEKNHTHESLDDMWQKCREAHLMLARRENAPIIKANQLPEQVVYDLMQYIEPLILRNK